MTEEISGAARSELSTLASAAAALRQGEIDATEFGRRVVEACATLISALPPPYARAMDDIVTRFQSAALFSTESCSFSQEDLHNALSHWLEKAGQKLGA